MTGDCSSSLNPWPWSRVEPRVEWVMVRSQARPPLHQPPLIRGWPSPGTGRRRTGPRWETEGELCVLCSALSCVTKLARGGGWYQRPGHGLMSDQGTWGGCQWQYSVLCVRWHWASCTLLSWIIENNVFTSRVGTLVFCELARYILSLCIIARQLNSILQNIITFSDTQIGGQNKRSKR